MWQRCSYLFRCPFEPVCEKIIKPTHSHCSIRVVIIYLHQVPRYPFIDKPVKNDA